MIFLEKYSLNPLYKIEQFDNEILLYSGSVADGLYLNETAYLIWQMCDQGFSVEEMTVHLENAYPDQKEMIRGDVSAAIESLVESGALIASND
ncbi:MAG: PqqD family protein [Desulfobulbaceae bacterium]|nr:PqqD family protein [Desulfobulbaceae bacterium]